MKECMGKIRQWCCHPVAEFILVIVLLLLNILLSSCSTSNDRHKADFLSRFPLEEEVEVKLRFEHPGTIATPKREPVTVEEHIRSGLFYFEQEMYAEAAEAFEKAGRKVADRRNDIYRSCLVSIAVCRLLVNDRTAFVEAIREIQSTYSRHELAVITRKDRRMEALFALSDKFERNETN